MAKTTSKIISLLIIAYLVTFPFGQIAAFDVSGYEIHIADVLVATIAALHFLRKKGRVFYYFKIFAVAVLFSYLISLVYFNFENILGFLYLGRLLSYIILFDAVITQIKTNEIKDKKLQSLLIYFGTLTAIIGLVQYILLPDLRFLYQFGWDRHLGRLAGLYFDPAFIGLILVLNILLVLRKYFVSKNNNLLLIIFINLSAVLLTFSRASYLALIVGFLFLFWRKIKLKKIILIIIAFIISLNFLPKFSSEGTNLLRTSTIIARFGDYRSSVDVIRANPILGVGYNNLCEYKVRLDQDVISSHTCSGFDSSILMLIATTGIIGLIAFFFSLKEVTNMVKEKSIDLVYASYAAVFIHSLFSNSMFYPWTLGWMFLLLPTVMKTKE